MTPLAAKVNAPALTVFLLLLALVTVLGFLAARWRRAANTRHLDEWGLGGRSFGTWVTWFLLGGDAYTAYTFVAVPAAVFATGAAGFWSVPYAAMVYPLVFLLLPRLWSVARVHGYVTPADFVRGRYGSRALGLAVALTGILATMPYIALQLVGLEAVLNVMGLGGGPGASPLVKDLPLLLAFAVLAAYTYSSGLRAPALIAFVKDTLVYLVVLVAVVYLPMRLGGYHHIFDTAAAKYRAVSPATHQPVGSLVPGSSAQWAYATLALGSALALFMYPHTVTGVLAAKSRRTVRRNMALLPAYSLLLGLLALLGFMAVTDGVGKGVKGYNAQLAVPQLFADLFPGWFAGVAFAAIGIGALVPAAIMSIGAANLFTRNVYKEFVRPGATAEQETKVAKYVSLLVKFGALVFVLGTDQQLAINLQLLGGLWILQTVPTIGAGLFTRWFHRWALLGGWAVGMAYGSWQAYGIASPATKHFGGSTALIPLIGRTGYIGLTAFVLNLVTATALTVLLRALRAPQGADETRPADYRAEVGDGTGPSDHQPDAGSPAAADTGDHQPDAGSPAAADAGGPEPAPATAPTG
ncbi:sodium:solute symporter [Kitasatospora sp. RB6PN24]|uniref:monocarboxylate uptake permease MctP n=1 Tax=Kitasatospora humi TaxID=2893891 RepID=UPI001E3AAF40|nr:sodium:solute symporter [Kitasatospora humi]MCC9307376.1 sodium:solute symporter [Kitasatospora humi]